MIEIKIKGADEFVKALKEVEAKFPEEIIKKLDEKATTLEKVIKDGYESGGHIRSGKLANSFKHKEPSKNFGEYEVVVRSNVPYAHLVESGHEMIGHRPKKVHIGKVKGIHVVEDSVDRMNIDYTKDLEEFIYSVLITRGGF